MRVYCSVVFFAELGCLQLAALPNHRSVHIERDEFLSDAALVSAEQQRRGHQQLLRDHAHGRSHADHTNFTVAASGTGSQMTSVTGLQVNTNYEFAVAAVNVMGSGPLSTFVWRLTHCSNCTSSQYISGPCTSTTGTVAQRALRVLPGRIRAVPALPLAIPSASVSVDCYFQCSFDRFGQLM